MKSFWSTKLLLALCLLIPIMILPYCFDRFASIKYFIFLCGSILLLFCLLLTPKNLSLLPRKIWFVILIFLSVQTLQTLRQPDLGSAFLGEYGQSEALLVQICFIIFCLAGFSFLDSAANFAKLRRILVITVYFLFIFGIYQYYFKDPFTQKIITRVSSLMGDPNSLGFFLILALPLIFDEYLNSGKWSGLALGSSLAGTITLFLTYSRAAWLSFVVIVLMIGFNWISQKPKKLLILGTTIFFALIIGQLLTKIQPYSHSDYNLPARLSSVTQGNDSGRNLLWSTAWQSFRNNPLLGRGLGSFQDTFHLLQSTAAVNHWGPDRDLRQVHNEFLHYLATQGLLGLGSYLALIISFLITSKLWRRHDPHRNEKTVLGAAIISYLIAMQFAYPLLHYSFLFWIYLGLLLRLELPCQPIEATTSRNLNFLQRSLATLIILIVCSVSIRIVVADYYYRQASTLSQAKKYYATADKNKLAAKIAPWNYQYQYRYGLTLIRCGRHQKYTRPEKSTAYFKEAETVFLDLKKRNPRRYQIALMLGKIAENQKQLAHAARYYQEALELFPNNYRLYFYLSRVELNRGHLEIAKSNFKQGLKLNQAYMLKMAKTAQLTERLL